MDCVRELPVKGLCLKKMEESDIAYVMECMEEAVLRSVSADESRDSEHWLPRLREGITLMHDSDPSSETFILWQDEERLGMIWLGRGHDQFTREPAGYLYGIYVSEDARNGGLARWMMSFAEEWCTENGLDTFCLNVGSYNHDAEKAYRRLGFSPRSTIMSKRVR